MPTASPLPPARQADSPEQELPAALSGDAQRLGRENLMSLLVIATGNAARDLDDIAALSAFAEAAFEYYELVVAAAAPAADWIAAMREAGSTLPNLRIITIDTAMSFEDAAPELLHHTIGDFVVCLQPGEISIAEFTAMVNRLADGSADLVRAVFPESAVPRGERWAAALIAAIVGLTTGQRLLGFQARAFALSRSAISRLLTLGGALRFFRLIDVSAYAAQSEVVIATPRRRNLFGALSEKMRLTADLISMSAGRLIRTFAFLCLGLSLLSVGVCAGSFVVWLVKADVAPGWTSLTMIFSTLFAANFGVLAAICLGLNQLVARDGRGRVDLVTSEISGGDFYSRDDRLNVDVRRSRP